MAMAQLDTSWRREELFDQTIALMTDDPNWMVQAQSNETLVLRREKTMGIARWVWLAVIIIVAIATCGLALLLLPTLLIGLNNQQISIRATQEAGKTRATINYTSGARNRVATLLKVAPRV